MKRIVLLSGGLDSATALYWVMGNPDDIMAITFDYELRQTRELNAARSIARSAGVQHTVIELPFYKKLRNSPSSSDESIGPEEKGQLSSAYVPARNIVFMGIAAAHAEIFGAEEIITGHIGEDVSRFPDVGVDFVKGFNSLLRLCSRPNSQPIVIRMPLLRLTKEQVLKEAVRLGVPLEETWSCYNAGDAPCGLCYGCRSRSEAFEAIGVDDPWMERRRGSI
jgi:7-cyano-7-deazaguanine synthase